jgi:hypothetical protein
MKSPVRSDEGPSRCFWKLPSIVQLSHPEKRTQTTGYKCTQDYKQRGQTNYKAAEEHSRCCDYKSALIQTQEKNKEIVSYEEPTVTASSRLKKSFA